ncbi:MAG: thiamine phosphate synthase [Kofleriaceae bacterium]
MNRIDRIRGFYAVLDRDDEALAQILLRHASVLQIRLKLGTAAEQLALARKARVWCDRAGALLIVNDRIDIALAARADGVHLGQSDVPFADARRLAPDLIIGVSTHDLDQVRGASHADYLGYGPVFTTRTKENPDPVQGVAALALAVRAAAPTPVVAIGGIATHHATEVANTGVAAICAISAVNNASDPDAAARSFARQIVLNAL